MKNVLVTELIQEDGLALLRERPDVNLTIAPDVMPETLTELLPEMHGVVVRLAKLPADLLSFSADSFCSLSGEFTSSNFLYHLELPLLVVSCFLG